MFLEVSQNSQENTCAGVSFLIKLQAQGVLIYILISVAGDSFGTLAKFSEKLRNISFLVKKCFFGTLGMYSKLVIPTSVTFNNTECGAILLKYRSNPPEVF